MMLQLQNVTKDREVKMNALWTEFQAILQNYSEKTGDKYAEYVELRQRDNADTKEIHQHYLDISRATRDIALLKDILESQASDHQMHMKQLKDYHKLLMGKQKKIKTAMSSTENVYKKRMKTFVVCSTEMNKVRFNDFKLMQRKRRIGGYQGNVDWLAEDLFNIISRLFLEPAKGKKK